MRSGYGFGWITTAMAEALEVSTAAETSPLAASRGSSIQAPRSDSLIVGVLTAVLYAALRQSTCYGDGAWFLLQNDNGIQALETHCAYPLLLRLLRLVLEPIGGSLYTAGIALSVIGGSAGCALIHRATARLGVDRASAFLVAALVACAPAVMFFSTVVELHGPFFAFFGLAALAFVRWLRAPAVGAGLLAGGSTALAYFAHATGVVLPGVFLLLACAWPASLGQVDKKKLAATGWVVLAVHAIVVVGVAAVLRAFGLAVDPGHAGSYLMDSAQRNAEGFHRLWTTLWVEWVVPYLPLSVLWVLGMKSRHTRRMTFAFALCLAGYLGFTFLLLGDYPEHGAYLLPMAWPAALLTLTAIPRKALLGAAAIGLGTGLHSIASYDVPERGREYAEGFRHLFGQKRVLLLVGDYMDLEARFVRLPEQPYFFILDVAKLEAPTAEAVLPQLETHLRQELERYDCVVLTTGAEQMMLVSAAVRRARTGGTVVLEFFRSRFRLEAIASRGFAGYLVHP